MTANARLIDDIRALEAELHGKKIELYMALGDREQAEFHRREMYAVINARVAAAEIEVEEGAGCYFDARGLLDGLTLRGLAG